MSSPRNLVAHLLVLGTVVLTVYGQLVIKWQVGRIGAPESSAGGAARFMLALLLNPWVVSGLVSAFGAFACWAGAVSKLPLSYAYPFTSLSFVLVVLLSKPLFGEAFTPQRATGVCVILLGLWISTRG